MHDTRALLHDLTKMATTHEWCKRSPKGHFDNHPILAVTVNYRHHFSFRALCAFLVTEWVPCCRLPWRSLTNSVKSWQSFTADCFRTTSSVCFTLSWVFVAMIMAVSWYQSRSFVAQSEHSLPVKMSSSKWRAFSTAWRQRWRIETTAKLEQDLPEQFPTCTCGRIVHWYPFELRKPVMRTRTRVVRLSHFPVSVPVQFRLLNNIYGSLGPFQ